MLAISSFAFLAFWLSGISYGLNDWSVPCLDGKCSYDMHASDGTSSGSFEIWSDGDAISDITSAAGWEVLGCDSGLLEQEIRMVCRRDRADDCDHLFKSGSAQNKVVRLPENCGKSAFARVVRIWDHADQSLPDYVAAFIGSSYWNRPKVKGIAIDSDFASIDRTKYGDVKFSMQGASHSSDRSLKRETFQKDLDPQTVDSSNASVPLLEQTLECGAFTADLNATATNATVHMVVKMSVSASGSFGQKPDNFSLITTVDGNIDGTIDLQAAISGSVDSPKVEIFALPLTPLSFPGVLDIGPRLEISAKATASLEVDVGMSVGVSYTVENARLEFPPPKKSDGNNTGNFTPNQIPLQLSVAPSSVKAIGSVEVHLIPAVIAGVKAFGGVAEADIFLNFDASAKAQLTLEATLGQNGTSGSSSSSGSATSAGNARRTFPTPSTRAVKADQVARRQDSSSSAPPSLPSGMSPESYCVQTCQNGGGLMTGSSTAGAPMPSASSNSSSSPGSGVDAIAGSLGGCFEITAGLSVNAGATGTFFDFFDENSQVTLFEKNFELFKKCFGNPVSTRRRGFAIHGTGVGHTRRIVRASRAAASRLLLEKRALQCPKSQPAQQQKVVDTAMTPK